MKVKHASLITLFAIPHFFLAQTYAPPVGQAGTTAMYKDSSAFVSWAINSKIVRGDEDVSNPSLGVVSVGDSTMATGKAESNGVVSLGDGGSATCTFARPVMNGPGFDFAVFENSFDDTFLELAFVEVSSDGVNFVRFPAHSLTDTVTQTASFGSTDATKINNLAGKYRGGYGTPFDLQELAGKANLDIQAITHIKIIDVVGSINDLYATRDSYGNKVNDPWPTAFSSGGFDLDAVGVMYENLTTGLATNKLKDELLVYPNPINKTEKLNVNTDLVITALTVSDISGKVLLASREKSLDISQLKSGFYTLTISINGEVAHRKIVVD